MPEKGYIYQVISYVLTIHPIFIIAFKVSFRSLPAPSLSSIRKICEHYEAKCSGRYNSLGSRYVIQMAKEIRTQIDAMSRLNAPKNACHCACGWKRERRIFNFERMDDRDDSSSSHDGSEKTRKYFQDIDTRDEVETGLRGMMDMPLHPELEDIKRKLLRTKIELQEKAIELDRKDTQNNQKLQDERQHLRKTTEILIEQHKDEIEKLQKEIAKVKNDAKVVIDFVRKKANKALDNEMEKRKNDRIRLSKHFEEKEAILRERFNIGLDKVERRVKQALNNEKFIVHERLENELPSPPKPVARPRTVTNIPSNRMRLQRSRRREFSNASDASVQGDFRADDSLSTRESQDIDLSKNRQWFQQRIDELEEWTDTLTATFRGNDTLDRTPDTLTADSSPPSPPPLNRVTTRGEWDI